MIIYHILISYVCQVCFLGKSSIIRHFPSNPLNVINDNAQPHLHMCMNVCGADMSHGIHGTKCCQQNHKNHANLYSRKFPQLTLRLCLRLRFCSSSGCQAGFGICFLLCCFCNGAHLPENPVLRVLTLSSFQDGAIAYLSSPVCRRIPFTVFSQEHLLLEINLLRVGEVSRSRNRSRKASHKQAREAATPFHVSVFVCPSGLSRKIALTSEWFFSPMLIGSQWVF